MSQAETLNIYIDTYQFVKEIYQMTHKFSREYKYCLGEQINKDVLKLLYHIFQANHIKEERISALCQFMACLDMVRVELRLAHDMKVLSTRQMAHLAQFLDKIVKQAAAWQKYQRTRNHQQKEDKNNSLLPEPDTIIKG